MLRTQITPLLLTALLCGCAGLPSYTPMTQEKLDSIQSMEVYNYLGIDEVRPAIELSNASGAMGGGLIPALIDASINDDRALSARTQMEHFYNVTDDMNVRVIHAGHFNPVFSALKGMNQKGSAEVLAMTDAELKAKIATLKQGEGYMFLTSHYQFMDDFKVLHTAVSVFMYVGNGQKMELQKPTYRNTYMIQSPTIGTGGVISLSAWSKDNGALYRQQIESSLTEAAQLLAYDTKPMLQEACLGSVSFAYPTVLGVNSVEGKVIEQAPTRMTVRTKDGSLYRVDTANTRTTKSNLCGA